MAGTIGWVRCYVGLSYNGGKGGDKADREVMIINDWFDRHIDADLYVSHHLGKRFGLA